MAGVTLRECCLNVVNGSNIELSSLTISKDLIDKGVIDVGEYKSWNSFRTSVSSTLTRLQKEGKIQCKTLLENNTNKYMRQKRLFFSIPTNTIPVKQNSITLQQAIIDALRKFSGLSYAQLWMSIKIDKTYQFNCKNVLSEQTSVAGVVSLLERRGIIKSKKKHGIKLYSVKSNYVSSKNKCLKNRSYAKPKKYARGYLQKLCFDAIESVDRLVVPLSITNQLVSKYPEFPIHYKNKMSMQASVSHILKELAIKGKIQRFKKEKRYWYCKINHEKISRKQVYKADDQNKKISININTKVMENSDSTFLDTKLDGLFEKRNQINKDILAILRVQEIAKQKK